MTVMVQADPVGQASTASCSVLNVPVAPPVTTYAPVAAMGAICSFPRMPASICSKALPAPSVSVSL